MENNKLMFNELFEPPIEYPDFEFQERLNGLIGIDSQKARLGKILGLLVNPVGIKDWIAKYHKEAAKIENIVLKRPPLIVLEGDVGSGKSELAITIGDSVARQEKINITLLPLSLSSRGEGRVGQMTKLISAAFDYTIEKAKNLKNQSGDSRGAIILLIDEADALAQSRESSQMHHEDKAGVNAFIRGIDRISNDKLPAAIIMCTNRINALDPAVKRRAADILKFERPNESQRYSVLVEPLMELKFTQKEIECISKITGENNSREYGFTYSDLMQRMLPSIILDAYPNGPVRFERAKEIIESIQPTKPFNDY